MRARKSGKQFRKNLGRCFSAVLILFGLRILWALSLRHGDVPVVALNQPDGFPIVLYTIDANNSDFSNTRQDSNLIVTVKTEGRKTLVYATERLDSLNGKQNASVGLTGPVAKLPSDPIVINATRSSKSTKEQKTILDYVEETDKSSSEKHADIYILNNASSKAKENTTQDVEKLLSREALKGVCRAVPTWGKPYHAQVSTFDLLSTLVYHTDAAGNYPIPTRTFKEIEMYTNQTEPLQVILVPFSHADPGYGLTLEEYYKTKTQKTLDLMIQKLYQYPNMTFQWAETVFLARWFEDLDKEQKAKVRQLIKRGQLEIVSGGWVMPDESQTTVTSVVDQLIEGHQWLQEHLQVTPVSAWVNDPFGYSSTFPYLWKSAGMENMLFLRINQPLKAKLMEMKSMDFLWRPYWLTQNKTDMLATLMPYTNYWVDDVCGPNPKICSKFNYLHLGEKNRNAVRVDNTNVEHLATELYQQLRISSDLFKYNILYIGLGEDFSYTKAREWDDMYVNYQKLMEYMNNKKDWKIKIKFGTLTEYFTKLRKNEKQAVADENQRHKHFNQGHFPSLSGDFFPYTDRNKEFWTGYFTTRPLNKRFSREIESLLHAADTFNVIVHSIFRYYGVPYRASTIIAGELRAARRELSIFMHHDGITGTSVPHVVRDFEKRLVKSYLHTHTAMKKILVSLLSRGKINEEDILREEYFKPASRQISEKSAFDTTKELKLVLVNPTLRRRTEIIDLHVNSEMFTISSPFKSDIGKQVQDSLVLNGKPYKTASFEIDIPAFGIEVFTINPEARKSSDSNDGITDHTSGENDALALENMNMKVEFSKESGMIKRVIHKDGKVTEIATEFHTFYTTAGGAYIMDAESREIPFSVGQRYVTVTEGPIMSEVKVSSEGFVFRVRLYNTTGISGHGIHVNLELNMASLGMRNTDVVMIIRTDIGSGPNFYTDQNNFNLIGRKTRQIISEAYYPISSMLVIEDFYKRLNVHTRQPHGVSSLDGAIEVMLDRHTFRDDGRGLGQGVYDNVRVNSDFILHIEQKEATFQPLEQRYTYPTEDAVLMNEFLQNPVIIYSQTNDIAKLLTKVHPLKSAQFPCDTNIVKLRNVWKESLEYNSTSLTLHRRSLHCGFVTQNNQCQSLNKPLTIKDLFPKLKVKVIETSLSLLFDKKHLSLEDDIRPNRDELVTLKVKL